MAWNLGSLTPVLGLYLNFQAMDLKGRNVVKKKLQGKSIGSVLTILSLYEQLVTHENVSE